MYNTHDSDKTHPGCWTISRSALTASSLVMCSKLTPFTSSNMSPVSIRPSAATAPLREGGGGGGNGMNEGKNHKWTTHIHIKCKAKTVVQEPSLKLRELGQRRWTTIATIHVRRKGTLQKHCRLTTKSEGQQHKAIHMYVHCTQKGL